MESLTKRAVCISKAALLRSPARRNRRSGAARWVSTWLSCFLWLSVPFLVGHLHARAQHNPPEYEVKAAFLLNFAKFVEWPATAFSAPDTPITICILGVDPFGPILDRVVEGQSVNNRAVKTRRSVPEANPRGCHIAFISRYERQGMAQIASDFGKSGVLTVSELPGFTAMGGMIEFVTEEDQIEFYVNTTRAEAAGLKLSSQLLRVAREVRGPEGTRP